MKNFYFGTSGWSYSHWKSLFYPEQFSTSHFLDYYAKYFPSVELNASFYHLPKVETVKKWVKTVPKDFLFCPKLSRLITHAKKLQNSEDLFKNYIEVFSHIKKNLGPILIQLPETLAFKPQKQECFFSFIQKHYSSFSFAIEARNPSWLEDEALAFLSHFNMHWVIVDAGKHYPTKEVILGKTVYLRFHGRKQLYASNYTKKMLQLYAQKCQTWLKEKNTIFAFFNNDFMAHAPQNALLLNDLINKIS